MKWTLRVAWIGGCVLATELLITHWFFPMLLTGELEWLLFYGLWLLGFGLASAFLAAWIDVWAEEMIEKGVVLSVRYYKAKFHRGCQTPSATSTAEKVDAVESSEGGVSGLMSSQ